MININFVSIFACESWRNLGYFLLTTYVLFIGGRGGIKMASASTLSLNEPVRVPHFSPHRKAKANDKRHNLMKNAI